MTRRVDRLRGRFEQPGIPPAAYILPPHKAAQPEVPLDELDEVGRRFPGQDPLDHVLMRGVSLRLALEDPQARLGAEDILPAFVDVDLRRVAFRRAPTEHELAKVTETNRRRPVGVPFNARPSLPPPLRDPFPDRIQQVPSARVLPS